MIQLKDLKRPTAACWILHCVPLVELYFAASHIEFNLYFIVLISQALEEESTSHLKIGSGISHALPAPSALLHWWALAFSLMATGSCAVTVTAIYRAFFYHLLTFS